MKTARKKTEIYLITGFLGAGKTTFLKGRLAASGLRTGVLINDFGKINYDGLQIKQNGLEMVELSNGSIFCSCLKDNFVDGLVHLIELGLDEVYIESSGLADPSEMGKILGLVARRAVGGFRFRGTICLVDSLFFLEVLPKMLSVERQISHSHLIIINKCDLTDEAQLQKIRVKISKLNARAKIIEASFGKIDWSSIQFDVFDIADEDTTNKIETRNKSLVLHLLEEPEADSFQSFLDALGSHFFRVKGFVDFSSQVQKVDLVNRQVRLEPATGKMDRSSINQLVCLTSQGLDSISHLAKMANNYIPGAFRLEM